MVVRDVTERRRFEEDLRRRAEELAAANRAKEEFLPIHGTRENLAGADGERNG